MAMTILFVVLGKNVLFAATLAISLIGMMELYRIVKVHRKAPGVAGYAAGILYYFLLYFNLPQYQLMLFVFFLMVLLAIMVFRFPEYKIEQIAVVFFGFFYVSMMSYIYQVRMMEGGALLVWLIFIGAWGSDTCAYCVGVLFGKHKFAPKLSPKKSIEGSIGGIVGAALIAFIYATIFQNKITGIENPQFAFTVIGAASSVLAQIGDLAASAIKRDYNIKDYGKLIPGHGGILDRFDSILFTAPVVYYLAVML